MLISECIHCELQILDLKKKQENQVQLLKEKQKSDEAAKRLQAEIQYIKSQKVGFIFRTSGSSISRTMNCIISYAFWIFVNQLFIICRFSCSIK